MADSTELQVVAPAARRAVESLLRERLQPFGLTEVLVKPTTDHEGDPVLRVEAIFGMAGVPVSGEVGIHLLTDLRAELERFGETRFPHVWYRYPPEASGNRRA